MCIQFFSSRRIYVLEIKYPIIIEIRIHPKLGKHFYVPLSNPQTQFHNKNKIILTLRQCPYKHHDIVEFQP